MTANGKPAGDKLKKVKTILISQPKPERSPYFNLAEKYNIKIDWRSFIHVEPVDAKEFRRSKIKPLEYNCVILNSKTAIDHFFRMATELRIKMSADTKYFCLSEAIANYLQKFIVYRKRKVFVGKRKIDDLKTYLNKHKTEEFLIPCSNLGSTAVTNYLDEQNYAYKEAVMYKTVASDLSDLSDITYDVLVFFSPLGIHSLYENFPQFKQNETRIAVYGAKTSNAVIEKGLTINIKAPEVDVPSMTMAIEKYLKVSNK